jgi:hypothetical protein
MEDSTLLVLTWRLNVVCMALPELVQSLPPREALRARQAIRMKVARLIAEGAMPRVAADPVAADLEALLTALGRRL